MSNSYVAVSLTPVAHYMGDGECTDPNNPRFLDVVPVELLEIIEDVKVGPDVKACSKCKSVKSLSEFHKLTRAKDGLRSDCKDCKRETNHKWREANPEHHRESSRKWREANPERERENGRKWRAENSEYDRERKRRWVEENPHVKRTLNAAHRIRNYGLAAENTPEEREAVIAWRHEIISKQLPCTYCGAPFDLESGWIEDHVIPLSRGGRDTFDNVVPACGPCNMSKHAKDLDEFLGGDQ